MAALLLFPVAAQAHVKVDITGIEPIRRTDCSLRVPNCRVYSTRDGDPILISWQGSHGSSHAADFTLLRTGDCANKGDLLPPFADEASSGSYADENQAAHFNLDPTLLKNPAGDNPSINQTTIRICYSANRHSDTDSSTGQGTTTTGTGQPATPDRDSAEATITLIFDDDPPGLPSNPRVEGLHQTLNTTWDTAADDQAIAFYQVGIDTNCHEEHQRDKEALRERVESEGLSVDESRTILAELETRCQNPISGDPPTIHDTDTGNELSASITKFQGGDLDNDTVYFLSVRAIDFAGNESNWAPAIGKPVAAVGPAEYFGETGCSSLGFAGSTPAVPSILFAPLLWFLRRRRAFKRQTSGAARHEHVRKGGIVVVAALCSALSALVNTRPAQAFSIQPTLLELGGGLFQPDDPRFEEFFLLKRSAVARGTLGWFFHRTVSLSFSAGFFSVSANGVRRPAKESDQALDLRSEGRTNDLYRTRVFPLQADLRLYLNFLKDQWVVPYGDVGGDEILGRSSHHRLAGSRNRVNFEKRGWHYGGGLLLLLDVVDRYHSNKLEDDYGIADTYIGLDARRARLPDEGFDFSGWTYAATFTFRLK